MDRRSFIGTIGGLVGITATSKSTTYNEPAAVQSKGPYIIEIISPAEDAGRDLPLFDSYKQAENFANARMNLYRQQPDYIQYEAGLIKVWSAENQVVFECSWGQSWTQATSYVDCEGRLT
tara:strand:- start:355 stop:714 length:360 start_codon:yes stop_codon:yes gene_type:complete